MIIVRRDLDLFSFGLGRTGGDCGSLGCRRLRLCRGNVEESEAPFVGGVDRVSDFVKGDLEGFEFSPL